MCPKPIKMQSSGTFLLLGQKVFVKAEGKQKRGDGENKNVTAVLLNVAH